MNATDEGREVKYWCEYVCGKAGGLVWLKHWVRERKGENKRKARVGGGSV